MGTVSLASQRGEGILRFLLRGVDEAVSMRVQRGTNMNISESWEEAYEKLVGRDCGAGRVWRALSHGAGTSATTASGSDSQPRRRVELSHLPVCVLAKQPLAAAPIPIPTAEHHRRRQDQLIRSKMPSMKHVMTMALIATAMLAAPAGHADPDPHKPDLGGNYCPGGGTPSPEPSCDGVPYPDGSYWHAIQRSTSGMNTFVVVQCVVQGTWPQPPVPLPAPPGGCGRAAQ